VREGILVKVENSEWVTPIVPIPTASGGIRIGGDFKQTVNKSLVIPQYPLPKIEDIFYKLEGGQKFSKIGF
jgi:hypothetical protein